LLFIGKKMGFFYILICFTNNLVLLKKLTFYKNPPFSGIRLITIEVKNCRNSAFCARYGSWRAISYVIIAYYHI